MADDRFAGLSSGGRAKQLRELQSNTHGTVALTTVSGVQSSWDQSRRRSAQDVPIIEVMRIMRKKLELTAAVVALLGVAACNSASAADKSLSHDLDLAVSSTATAPTGLSLAPSAGRTDVISSVERTPEAAPAPKPSAPQRSVVHQSAPHIVHHSALAASAPVTATPIAVAPIVAPAPAPSPVAVAPVPTSEATPAPRPTPTRQAEPRGGYRSVGDVIRNAPFPINP